MKNLLFFFAIMFSFITQAQTSLAEITGEENSLFNALAIYNNVEPEEFTVIEFREAAEAYGESIGMDYVCHPKNGWNNVEMLWHRLPSPELRRAPRITMREPTIGIFTTEMDVETQLVIQCIINSYKEDNSGILFPGNPLDTFNIEPSKE